mgnify:FL=1
MGNAVFKMWANEKYRYKDGYAIWLVVRKEGKRKVIATGYYAKAHQWDDKNQIFVTDKRISDLHPDRKRLNDWLTAKKAEIIQIIDEFERNKIDWTLNQFEAALFNNKHKGNVKEYWNQHITTLHETGHHGNAICYRNTLHLLTLFDKKITSRVFPEIDLKYVQDFDIFLQKRGCSGNTRKYYMKALRALLNKAIKDKEASRTTYPFGEDGFGIGSLEEETQKRYIPLDNLKTIKETVLTNKALELTRRIFLISYYCYGISFIDAAFLTRKNIVTLNRGDYIIYKRNKTRGAKKVKPIQIRISTDIQEQLDWFAAHSKLIGDYLVPIVSKDDYSGETLYNHVRSRCSRVNKNLKLLAETLGITKLPLTTYVSRHTMAMALQENEVPREVISQMLGHSDLQTTNVYLDCFESKVIDEAAMCL